MTGESVFPVSIRLTDPTTFTDYEGKYDITGVLGGVGALGGPYISTSYGEFMNLIRTVQSRNTANYDESMIILPWVGQWMILELARTVEDTPDVFSFLVEAEVKWVNEEERVKNWERWLYQRDEPPFLTTYMDAPITSFPAAPSQTRWQSWWDKNDWIARSGISIGFDVDNRFIANNGAVLKITFFDTNEGFITARFKHAINGDKIFSAETYGTEKLLTVTFQLEEIDTSWADEVVYNGVKRDFFIESFRKNGERQYSTVSFVRIIRL